MGKRVNDNSGQNIHIDVKQVTNKNGVGLFRGDSSLSMLRFSHTSLGRTVYIKVKFMDNEQGSARQVLVSNCRTTTSVGRTPSVAIELDKPNLQVDLIAGTRANHVNISLPYKVSFV